MTQDLIEARALALVRPAVKGAPFQAAIRDETAASRLCWPSPRARLGTRGVLPFTEPRSDETKPAPFGAS